MNLIEFLIYSEELGITALFTDRRQIYTVNPFNPPTQPAQWHREIGTLGPRLLRSLIRLPEDLLKILVRRVFASHLHWLTAKVSA